MEQLLEKLHQQVTSKYYGKYRGFVVNREDPLQKGRLKLKVPAVLGDEESGWALPCFPCGGVDGSGWNAVPELDAQVWVEFEGGDISLPIWTGTFFGDNDALPAEMLASYPQVQAIKTAAGHLIELNDTEGEEQIVLKHCAGQHLHMDKDGNVILKNSDEGCVLTLSTSDGSVTCQDVNGNKVEMTSAGVKIEEAGGCTVELASGSATIKSAADITLESGAFINLGGAGGEGLLKGNSFLGAYMAHTHPVPTGMSGPPIPAGEMSSVSMKVKTV